MKWPKGVSLTGFYNNPNLAIVADAEQIIYMNIDKETDYKVTCNTGGIENSVINNHIVDILEGKMKAFNNRRIKYKRRACPCGAYSKSILSTKRI